MNKENVTTLRDFLINLPDRKFQMGCFYSIVNEDTEKYSSDIWALNEKNHCGTAACLTGWAGIVFNNEHRTDVRFLASRLEINFTLARKLTYGSHYDRDPEDPDFYFYSTPHLNKVTREEVIEKLNLILKGELK